jgi:glucosamine-phosphate N-acetyltransferase
MLDVLRVLTSVGDISEAAWTRRYDWMVGVNALGGGPGTQDEAGDRGEGAPGGTYFVLVVEDAEGRVVGTGAVVVERKL